MQITLPGSPEMLTAAVQDADRCDTALASEALLDVEGAPIGDRTEPGKLGLRAGLFIVGQTHRAECGTTALVGGATVQGANKERWRELCEQAAVEQDPKKLLELTKEINELLLGKQHRLSSDTPVDTPKDSE